MTALALLTGERHQLRAETRRRPDDRVIRTACGEYVALTGSPPDPTSAYQRAVFPLAFHPTRCPRCPP